MTSIPHDEKRTCPCKKLPWSLSSFSAAEYGDVHSLLRKRPGTDVWNRRDSAGYTPLHLAAQHNHVRVTSLLLRSGAYVNGGMVGEDEDEDDNNNANRGTATPLHRAAFSGATATMRLLMQEADCNLLARDASFGDFKTPLHKAVAGGRYLAVQLLLDELRERNQLTEALKTPDASSRTPLQVAEDIFSRQEQERQSVARWDEVAGGLADWGKCRALLLAATDAQQNSKTSTVHPSSMGSKAMTGSEHPKTPNNSTLPPLPQHLSTLDGCLDCDAAGGTGGTCLTSSWQTAFQAALGNAVEQSLGNAMSQGKEEGYTYNGDGAAYRGPSFPTQSGDKSSEATRRATAIASGVTCMSCKQKAISLYRTSQGLLVCKTCRRQMGS